MRSLDFTPQKLSTPPATPLKSTRKIGVFHFSLKLLDGTELNVGHQGAAAIQPNTGIRCIHKLVCTETCRKPSLHSPALRRTSIAQREQPEAKTSRWPAKKEHEPCAAHYKY